MNGDTKVVPDIIIVLTTLYAIVPSVIIVIMYNFLSTIEIRIGDLFIADIRNGAKVSVDMRIINSAREFVAISSKFLHLTMAYYLLLLSTSLLAKIFSIGDECATYLFIAGTTGAVIYNLCYYICNISKSFERLENDKRGKRITISILHDIIMIFLFIIVPISSLSIIIQYDCNIGYHVVINLIWITLTISMIMVWWLWYPFKYEPLSALNRCIKTYKDEKNELDRIEESIKEIRDLIKSLAPPADR